MHGTVPTCGGSIGIITRACYQGPLRYCRSGQPVLHAHGNCFLYDSVLCMSAERKVSGVTVWLRSWPQCCRCGDFRSRLTQLTEIYQKLWAYIQDMVSKRSMLDHAVAVVELIVVQVSYDHFIWSSSNVSYPPGDERINNKEFDVLSKQFSSPAQVRCGHR